MKSACIAICVDDFGLHEGITRSVIALAEQGRVNGVGCMVAGPAWDSARGEAAALRAGGVDIGLHLDLTEHPVDVRLRKPLPRLILDACLGRLPEMQLEHEIRAQLDRFEQQLGHAPDYIDGHRHVHQLPQVRSVLLRCLTPRGEQPWLRSTRRAKNLVAPRQASVAERVKPGLVEALGGRGLERALHWANLRRNRRLLGLYGFSAEETRYRAWIDAWLQAAEDRKSVV